MKSTSSRTKKTEEPVAPTTTTAAAPAATKKKATKTAEPKAVAPKVEAPKVAEPKVEEAKVEEADTPATVNLANQSVELMNKMSAVLTTLTQLKTDAKALFKKYEREVKAAQKASVKGKRKSGNRAPSGFVMPAKISDELARFLDKPLGTELARTEVTRELNKYIISNNLQNKGNGRKINADAKLSTLLKLTPDIELTYFNLQHYMSPHFAKKGKPLATGA
jgi:chromatin remodeling complex protein RSC6